MRLARLLLVLACVAACSVLLAACGKGEPSTPDACFEGAGAYEQALAAAPEEVRVGGETLISECLAERQGAGELAQVGEALVAAATHLNSEAREDPGGKANLELGYLLGAATSGAEVTEGIHQNLIRRLEAAASFQPGRQPVTPAFLHTFRRGFQAGQEHG